MRKEIIGSYQRFGDSSLFWQFPTYAYVEMFPVSNTASPLPLNTADPRFTATRLSQGL